MFLIFDIVLLTKLFSKSVTGSIVFFSEDVILHQQSLSCRYSKACEKGFDFNGYKKGVEPFAQLVWKATSFLGMGKAVSNRDGNLCTYIVARYSPEGDKTSFLENVPKGTFSKDGICNSSCVVKGNIANKEGS